MGDGTGCDNMTCVIVRFKNFKGELKFPVKEEEGDSQKRPAAEEEATEKDAEAGPPPAKKPCSE